jgi:hypothetical protein
VVGKPVLDDLDRLHAEVEDAKRQLLLLGIPQSRSPTWLRTLNWDDFQDTEARSAKWWVPDSRVTIQRAPSTPSASAGASGRRCQCRRRRSGRQPRFLREPLA